MVQGTDAGGSWCSAVPPSRHAPALLAVLLLAATVDPRLGEPLRLLAQVRTAVHDVTGESIGPMMSARAAPRFVTVVVAPTDPGRFAHYDRATRTIAISEVLAAEDPQVVAGAHEVATGAAAVRRTVRPPTAPGCGHVRTGPCGAGRPHGRTGRRRGGTRDSKRDEGDARRGVGGGHPHRRLARPQGVGADLRAPRMLRRQTRGGGSMFASPARVGQCPTPGKRCSGEAGTAGPRELRRRGRPWGGHAVEER